jgi:hypothetical protein
MWNKLQAILKSLLAFSVVFIAGCSQQGLQSLEGQLVHQDGGAFEFAGDTIELRSQSDPTQHAFGEIKPDGKFKIDSLDEGKILQGAKPGEYVARIVIADDDYEHKKVAAKSINKKFLNFETSGLSVKVPTSGLTLSISK